MRERVFRSPVLALCRMFLAGRRAGADANAVWVYTGADAECSNAANIGFDNACATFHSYSRSAGDSSFT